MNMNEINLSIYIFLFLTNKSFLFTKIYKTSICILKNYQNKLIYYRKKIFYIRKKINLKKEYF
jgi:hypothetical protein